jgi:LacI family transcriptional regulator
VAASVKDVAAVAGVSVGTVSNVLNRPELVAAATVARVRAAIDELGFVRNDAAHRLRAGSSSTIGLVVLDVANPFFADLIRSAERQAARHGLTVLVGNSDQDPEREAQHVAAFERQRVRGLLISPVGDDGAHVASLAASAIPCVLVDRADPGRVLPSVAVDDVEGGRVAVEHLLALGRRRIAFVGGPMGIRQVSDRLRGARRAIDGVDGAVLEVVETSALSVLEGRRAGSDLCARPVGERPDGIFAANDLLALGALQALVMLSDLRVPEDVALIGYDDIDFASSAVVPLSSVRQPSALLGSRAVDLLLAGATGDEQVLFQPDLVVRESTAGRGA